MRKMLLTLASLLVVSLLVFFPSVYAADPPSLDIAVYMDCSAIAYMDIDDSEMSLKGYGLGTFMMSGDFSDSGVAAQPWWEVETDIYTGIGEMKGKIGIKGTKGALGISFEGTLTPGEPGYSVCAGEWTTVYGTGSYEGLSGQGTFTTVTNLETFEVIGTFVGLES